LKELQDNSHRALATECTNLIGKVDRLLYLMRDSNKQMDLCAYLIFSSKLRLRLAYIWMTAFVHISDFI